MSILKRIRKSLQLKFMMILVLMSAMLVVSIGSAIAHWYRGHMEDYYAELAFDYAKIGAEYIDGDTIREYARTLETDEYYDQVNDYLRYIKETVGMKYFYVVIPNEDQMFYIWDAGGPCLLGEEEDYYGGGKQIMRGAFLNPGGEDTILITNNDEYGYLASAYVAILDSEGNAVGLSSVDISMDFINQQISEFVITVNIVVGAILLLFLLGTFFFVRKAILDPLGQLSKAAQSIIGSHMDDLANFKVEIHTGDEVEELGDAFTFMAHELDNYIQNLSVVTAEKERIGTELNVATQIQKDMLPNIFPAFPERKEFDIYATMTPAKEVGGDFYDFFMVDDTHLAVVMADVSGKGVPAALFMVIAKTIIKNQALVGDAVEQVFMHANDQLCENNGEGLFVTAFMGVLDLTSGEFAYVNAGHNPPLLRRNGETYEYLKVKPGFVLAGLDGMVYKSDKLTMQPGDTLFLYTDGVTEALNVEQELYGEERLHAALNAGVVDKMNVRGLLPYIHTELGEFAKGAEQADDITMLAMTYRGTEKQQEDEVDAMEKTITVPARRDQLEVVQSFVDEMLKDMNCDPTGLLQLQIAIEEIFVNIASYAYNPKAGDAVIDCKVEPEEQRVTIQFRDDGTPFNPLAKEDADITLSAEERDIGGLGIYMVKESMDAVDYAYENGKNVLTIQKRLA